MSTSCIEMAKKGNGEKWHCVCHFNISHHSFYSSIVHMLVHMKQCKSNEEPSSIQKKKHRHVNKLCTVKTKGIKEAKEDDKRRHGNARYC